MNYYSAQLDSWIEAKTYAVSYTEKSKINSYVRYIIDNHGLIHSCSLSSSAISIVPVSAEELKDLANRKNIKLEIL